MKTFSNILLLLVLTQAAPFEDLLGLQVFVLPPNGVRGYSLHGLPGVDSDEQARRVIEPLISALMTAWDEWDLFAQGTDLVSVSRNLGAGVTLQCVTGDRSFATIELEDVLATEGKGWLGSAGKEAFNIHLSHLERPDALQQRAVRVCASARYLWHLLRIDIQTTRTSDESSFLYDFVLVDSPDGGIVTVSP